MEETRQLAHPLDLLDLKKPKRHLPQLSWGRDAQVAGSTEQRMILAIIVTLTNAGTP